MCDYVKLGLKISGQFLNHIVSTQSFHSKKQKFNQFIDQISMSVAWPGVGQRFGRGTKAEGLAALLGALGTVGLLAIRRGSGMPAIRVLLLSWFWWYSMVAGVAPSVWWWSFCALGLGCCWTGLLCWAVACFWFRLGNPRPSQECPNIFIRA